MQSSSKKSLNTIILAPLTPYKPKKCRAKFLEQKKFKTVQLCLISVSSETASLCLSHIGIFLSHRRKWKHHPCYKRRCHPLGFVFCLFLKATKSDKAFTGNSTAKNVFYNLGLSFAKINFNSVWFFDGVKVEVIVGAHLVGWWVQG